MREILFRGKRMNGEAWVEGSLICFADGCAFICVQSNNDDELDKYEVIPETVGQDTNKKDTNGKKIFEYDIIKEGCNGLIGVVIWDNDLATYNLDGFGEGYTIQDAKIEWEVIGNIHDNPELLKGSESDA